jgi:hypothetical protein
MNLIMNLNVTGRNSRAALSMARRRLYILPGTVFQYPPQISDGTQTENSTGILMT